MVASIGIVTSAIRIAPVICRSEVVLLYPDSRSIDLWLGWLGMLSLCGIPTIPDQPKPLTNYDVTVGWLTSIFFDEHPRTQSPMIEFSLQPVL